MRFQHLIPLPLLCLSMSISALISSASSLPWITHYNFPYMAWKVWWHFSNRPFSGFQPIIPLIPLDIDSITDIKRLRVWTVHNRKNVAVFIKAFLANESLAFGGERRTDMS